MTNAREGGGNPVYLEVEVVCELGAAMKRSTSTTIRYLALSFGLTLACIGVAAGYGRQRFGSVARALEYLKGRRLFVDQETVSLGSIDAGRDDEAEFRFDNLSSRPVRLVGSGTSCGCATVDRSLVQVEPHSSHRLKVRARLDAKQTGPIAIKVFTDDPGRFEVQLFVSAEVVAPSSTTSIDRPVVPGPGEPEPRLWPVPR